MRVPTCDVGLVGTYHFVEVGLSHIVSAFKPLMEVNAIVEITHTSDIPRISDALSHGAYIATTAAACWDAVKKKPHKKPFRKCYQSVLSYNVCHTSLNSI